MKIRFLLHNVYGKGGGVVTVTLALAGELARRHDVEIWTLFGRPPSVHPLPRGVRVRKLITIRDRLGLVRPSNFRAWRAPSRLVPPIESRHDHYSAWTDTLLARRLSELDGGALISMQPGLNLAMAQAAPTGCVLVAQEHRPFKTRAGQILEGYRDHAHGLSAFLTLTKADAREYRDWLGERVEVRAIPNGMPTGTAPVSDLSAKRVVAAGRLARSKGFDVLVDAWVIVAGKHPDWELEIWGEGESEEELRQQVRDRGLEGRVHLRGFSSRLQSQLAAGSVFVLSSRAEGYPRVILEAMSCGLPVVSTNCPSGPREMITPGVDGLLVPNQDAEAMGLAIVELIEAGPAGRREMGAAGLARVHAQSQDAIARKWERLLRRLDREGRSGNGGAV